MIDNNCHHSLKFVKIQIAKQWWVIRVETKKVYYYILGDFGYFCFLSGNKDEFVTDLLNHKMQNKPKDSYICISQEINYQLKYFVKVLWMHMKKVTVLLIQYFPT
jgi:hypothetical protein